MSDDAMHPQLAAAIDALADPADAAASAAAASSSSSGGGLLPHQYAPQSVEVETHAAAAEVAAAQAAARNTQLSVAVVLRAGEEGMLLHALAHAGEQGFDAVVAPLGQPRSSGTGAGSAAAAHHLSFTEPDTLMSASRWAPRVLGKISDWIHLDGCAAAADRAHPDAHLASFQARRAAEEAFRREVSWAVHLSLPAILVPNVTPGRTDNAARAINQALLQTQFLSVWVLCPLVAPSAPFDLHADAGASSAEAAAPAVAADPWEAWNRVRNLCESHRRLGVALEIGPDLPDFLATEEEENKLDPTLPPGRAGCDNRTPEQMVLSRWLGEPLRAVVLSSELFSPNKKGFPILGRRHQQLLRRLFEMSKDLQWIIRDETNGTNSNIDFSKLDMSFGASAAGATAAAPAATPSAAAALQVSAASALSSHQGYLRHLFHQWVLKVFTCQRSFEAPYRDVLQAPLQPLADNLESGVYEVFERDPVKYKQYEEAVAQALTDRFVHSNSADPGSRQRTAEVLVVGAGRGPLIRCVLAASARTGVPVRVHALEKNPNAVLTLRSLQRHDPAFRDVHIVATDARDWEGPTAVAAASGAAGDGAPPSRSGRGFADILVSELLGSFGDNELSPECLEGVCAKFLVPNTGISIPQSSSSYLVPVSSSRLWSDVLAQGNELKSMETSYVCALHNYYRASNVIKPVFKFVHRAPPATEGTAVAAEEQTEGDWSDDENEEVVAAERTRREAFKASSAAAAASGAAATVHAAASGLPADSSVPPVCHSRHTRLSFPIPLSCTVHGLAGFFSSRLYKSVHLSIIPGARFSTGMFSWFPLFFPLRTPVGVLAGQNIEVDLWRATTDRKVWYEWAVAAPQTTPIHNPNGRSSYIGL